MPCITGSPNILQNELKLNTNMYTEKISSVLVPPARAERLEVIVSVCLLVNRLISYVGNYTSGLYPGLQEELEDTFLVFRIFYYRKCLETLFSVIATWQEVLKDILCKKLTLGGSVLGLKTLQEVLKRHFSVLMILPQEVLKDTRINHKKSLKTP